MTPEEQKEQDEIQKTVVCTGTSLKTYCNDLANETYNKLAGEKPFDWKTAYCARFGLCKGKWLSTCQCKKELKFISSLLEDEFMKGYKDRDVELKEYRNEILDEVKREVEKHYEYDTSIYDGSPFRVENETTEALDDISTRLDSLKV